LNKLEGFLSKPIIYLNPDRDFDCWHRQLNNFLPYPQTSWCTGQLKLRPFEDWVKPMLNKDIKVYSYFAIRADEEFPSTYNSKHDNLEILLPFKEVGIDKEGVDGLLEINGLGSPSYYEWRTRSECTLCFYQQKIEWIGLLERHKEAYERLCLMKG
jgi:thiol-disulfide isomerase/thioredoxin